MEPGFFTIGGTRFLIESVVATYEISVLEEALPFARFTIRVVHRAVGDYQASPNAHVRNVKSGDVEYTCGLGVSIGEAVQDAIKQFLGEVEKQSQIRVLGECDFVWTADHPPWLCDMPHPLESSNGLAGDLVKTSSAR
jgi:hypothetical protein